MSALPSSGAIVEDEIRPLLRGVSHAWAFWAAVVAGGALVLAADGATARVATVVYGGGLCALFGGSALYHRWRGDPRWRPLMRRVDHSTIFVFIAASATPPALLVLDGAAQVVVLAGVWTGAAAGVALSVAWIGAPRPLATAAYLAVGWFGLSAVPQLAARLPATPLVLLVAGGILYTVGAIVYARRRPDPWPATFGFHEVFHALVVAAAICHFVAIAGWIVPA